MNKQFLKLASGRKLSYRVYGNAQAETLIFFHGFPGSSIQGSLFDSSSYASQFNGISFDRPGFGESDFQDQRSLQSMAVDISEALSVLKIIAAKNGKEVEGSDYYVSGIGGLKEKQHGPMSGWMYSVNGVAPNMAAIKYNLKDGDKVVWYYVNYE